MGFVACANVVNALLARANGTGHPYTHGCVHQIEAEVDTTVSIPSVSGYLCQLASLCREVTDRPELLPLFVAIIMRVPGTIVTMGRERKRIAA